MIKIIFSWTKDASNVPKNSYFKHNAPILRKAWNSSIACIFCCVYQTQTDLILLQTAYNLYYIMEVCQEVSCQDIFSFC